MNGNYSEALEQQLRLSRSYSAAEKSGRLVSQIAVAGGLSQAAARQWAQMVMIPLMHGETFYWSTAMCTLLEAAGGSLSDWRCDPSMLPSSSGFMFFESPLSKALPKPVRAIGWETVYFQDSDPDKAWVPFTSANAFPDQADAVLVTAYSESNAGQTLPSSAAVIRVGEPIAAFMQRLSTQDASGSLGNPTTVKVKMQYFAAAILLMAQRILSFDAHPLERHARKRVEREFGGPAVSAVRVVLLRRIGIESVDPRHRTNTDWQCQWIVRGHWRQQFYPSKHASQPIWITPYVKGPEGMPLKPPRATVFAVVR